MATAVQSSQIKEHMDVISSDGKKVGAVDRMEGPSDIKLTRNDALDGTHHLIPMAWVDHVDQHVHLNRAVNDVTRRWKAA